MNWNHIIFFEKIEAKSQEKNGDKKNQNHNLAKMLIWINEK